MKNVWPCKVGTIPELVQLYRRYKLRLGLVVKYRPVSATRYGRYEPRQREWSTGIVEQVDGNYFRLSRL